MPDSPIRGLISRLTTLEAAVTAQQERHLSDLDRIARLERAVAALLAEQPTSIVPETIDSYFERIMP